MSNGTGCKGKIKYTCGKKHNAKCVDYEGDLHDNTELEACDCHSVEEVIEDINSELNAINDAIEVSGLGTLCIDYDEVGGKISIKEALQKLEEKICELVAHTGLETAGECSPIFDADITCLGLDLDCLVDPCGVQPTDLKGLLQLIITEVCK